MDKNELKYSIKRSKNKIEEPEEEQEETNSSITAGSIDKVIDLAFNPSKDKIREVTIIDRMQGRLLPQLDLISLTWDYILEIAAYRQDPENYMKKHKEKKPIPPNLINEFMYRTAQWQKSVAGKNLERATDIALAEIETRNTDNDNYIGEGDNWSE